MRRTSFLRGATLLALLQLVPVAASADPDDWSAVPEFRGSPEHFGLELRVGMYFPLNLGDAFSSADYFGGDVGPDLSAELHYFPGRIPYLGLLGGGIGVGWSQWDTPAPGGGENTERNPDEVDVARVHHAKGGQVGIDTACEGGAAVARPKEDLVEAAVLQSGISSCLGECEQ